MENVIFNELTAGDYDVDVGVVEYNHLDKKGKKVRSQMEIDFVANKGSSRCDIQSASSIPDEEKRRQEAEALRRVPDSFRKIVVVREDILPWQDKSGIQYMGIEQFLLEEDAMNA